MTPFSTYSLDTVSIAATTTSGRVALNKPDVASTCQVEIYNSGTTISFLKKGGSTVTATTSSRPVPPGAVIIDSIGPGVTHFAAITSSGTNTIYFTTGDGT